MPIIAGTVKIFPLSRKEFTPMSADLTRRIETVRNEGQNHY